MKGSHITYSAALIAKILGGKLFAATEKNQPIRHLLTDSRRLSFPEETCFFALKSERNDGHLFINDLIKSGVRCFVVSRQSDLPLHHELLDFILVENTLKALQQLGSFHRQQFQIPVIGITGSNGKTIVKEWLTTLLSNHQRIVNNPQSYNSQIGVPLSVWQLETQHELAVFEAGISRPGEMELLQKIIQPDIGIFTNIGPAHASGFSGNEQKIDEKLKLFTDSKVLIFCSDHQEIKERIDAATFKNDMQCISWGKSENNILQLIGMDQQQTDTTISARIGGVVYTIKIPFIDAASVENAMHCWTVCSYLGLDQHLIAKGMAQLSPVAMRLELREGINHSTLINDFYNSDLHSFAVALDFLQQQQQHPSKTIILSDILESGLDEESLYTSIAKMLQLKPVDQLVCVGPALLRNAGLFGFISARFYEKTEDLLFQFDAGFFAHSTVLLKGARRFGFERISTMLQQKAHETVLEIRLNNLIHNINYYRALLPSATKLMMMVKAFSYGSGSFEIASALQFHHVDYLAVAYADEGIELRKAGIKLPIMVMSPEEESFPLILQHQLEPEIFSFRVLEQLENALLHFDDDGAAVHIHIKIDTGMRRLGFEPDELPQLIDRIAANKRLKLKSVFSHLAASDNPLHDSFTNEQIIRFDAACLHLKNKLGDFDRHILNSAGIVRFPQAHYEMVRLGIGAYGIASTEADRNNLENVLALKSTIIQIKNVGAGESVGYNRSSKLDRNGVIGVVPIGYADGLPRALSNGKASLYVRGQAAPIIGAVCMDMCMIDLTGLTAKEGDEVVIFDANYSIERLAEASNTIAYELLTRISRRVKRVYIQE